MKSLSSDSSPISATSGTWVSAVGSAGTSSGTCSPVRVTTRSVKGSMSPPYAPVFLKLSPISCIRVIPFSRASKPASLSSTPFRTIFSKREDRHPATDFRGMAL